MAIGEERKGTSTSSNGESIGGLVRDITQDFSTLIRKEIELAKKEIAELAKQKAVGAALFVAALTMAILIIPFFLLTLIFVLAIWLSLWAASAIVTVLMIGLAVGAILIGKKKLAGHFLPEKTVESIKEDVQWAKHLRK